MWKDITPPSNQLIEATSPSKPIKKNRKVEEILQFDDGDVVIKFNNNKTARLSTSSTRQSFKTDSERFYTLANTNLATSSKQSDFYTPAQSVINSTSKANDLIFKGIINSRQYPSWGISTSQWRKLS